MSAAKQWEKCRNPNGTWNSNYGQYWFGEQAGIWSVVTELIRDPESRRAVIPMLSKDHMTPSTVDTVCTESVGFHIRDGYLHMSVHMRSTDMIWGLGTDIPAFSFLHRLVFGLLNNNLPIYMGDLDIVSMSFHVYERNFEMVNHMIRDGIDGYIGKDVNMPYCTCPDEALFLISKRGRDIDLDRIPSSFALTRWLYEPARSKM